MFVRSGMPFNYDVQAVSKETGLDCSDDVGLTQQEFKEESDINEIVRRFGLTGQLPDNVRVPVSGDFTGVTDFHSAMESVRHANEDFMMLPGELRARFNNDPQRLMEFVADGRNFDEAKKLGLLKADTLDVSKASETPAKSAENPQAV